LRVVVGAGQMAIQVAKYLGAGRVIAAGRNQTLLDMLPGLGADVVISLEGDPDEVFARLGHTAGDVDVVVDYLWGSPAERAISALVTDRTDRGKALSWIQIGSVAGPTASISSAALRSASLQILGSGQGSVSTAGLLAELPALATGIPDGTLTVDVVSIPLSRAETAWITPPSAGQRVVLCPDVN